MPKFVVEETLACWVTFRRTVEAADESEALVIQKLAIALTGTITARVSLAR